RRRGCEADGQHSNQHVDVETTIDHTFLLALAGRRKMSLPCPSPPGKPHMKHLELLGCSVPVQTSVSTCKIEITRRSWKEREQPADLLLVGLAPVLADFERLGEFDPRGALVPVARGQP